MVDWQRRLTEHILPRNRTKPAAPGKLTSYVTMAKNVDTMQTERIRLELEILGSELESEDLSGRQTPAIQPSLDPSHSASDDVSKEAGSTASPSYVVPTDTSTMAAPRTAPRGAFGRLVQLLRLAARVLLRRSTSIDVDRPDVLLKETGDLAASQGDRRSPP